MSGRGIALAFAAIAFVLLTGLVVANILEISTEEYQHFHGYTDSEHPTFNPASFYRLTLESAEAFWTAIASLIGIIGSAMLYLQVLSSNQAVEETHRGVQAQINAQRGKLIFRRCWSRRVEGVHHLFREFENIGAGPLVIKSARSTHRFFSIEGLEVWNYSSRFPIPTVTFPKGSEPSITLVMRAGETVTGRLRGSPDERLTILERTRKLTEEEGSELDSQKTAIFMEYSIIYETLFGEYERRFAWWIGGKYFSMVDEPDYNSDLPVNEQARAR